MKRPRRVPLLLRTYGEDRRQFYGQTESKDENCFVPVSGDEQSWPPDQMSSELLYQGRQSRREEPDHNDNQAPIRHAYSRPQHHHPNCRLSSDNLRTTSFVQFDAHSEGEETDSCRTRYLAGRRRRGAADDDIDPLDAVSSLTTTPASEPRQTHDQRRRRLEERFGEDAFRAIEALEYITEHLKQLDDYKKVRTCLFAFPFPSSHIETDLSTKAEKYLSQGFDARKQLIFLSVEEKERRVLFLHSSKAEKHPKQRFFFDLAYRSGALRSFLPDTNPP